MEKEKFDVSHFKMVKIPAGSFMMGNSHSGTRVVDISEFFISNIPVTQFFYNKVLGYNPSKLKGDLFPVENVNWYEAVVFCNALSIAYKLNPCYSVKDFDIKDIPADSPAWKDLKCDFGANGFRLPTEAEFENAATGPKKQLYPWGTTSGFSYVKDELTTNCQYNAAVVADLVKSGATVNVLKPGDVRVMPPREP